MKINEQTEDFITTHPQESSSKLAEEVDDKTFVLDEPYTLSHMANLSGLSSSFSLLEPVYKGSCKEDPAPLLSQPISTTVYWPLTLITSMSPPERVLGI